MSEIGVAFVGTGNVAEMHEQAIRSLPGVKLRGVCGVTEQESERRAKQWSVHGYKTFDEMLKDPQVDVVFVLTPLECHFEHASLAMRSGKHVIIEKPVAPTPHQICALQRIADIYAPEMQRAKALIERGDIGTICGMWIHFAIFHPEELTRSWPGALRQVGTHFFYLLLYLLGAPCRLYASKSRLHYKKIEQEDQFMVQLEMKSGALVSLFCTFACDDQTADPWTFHTKILGTNGGFSYTWRSAVFNRALGTLPIAIVPYEETFCEMDSYLLNRCIAHGERPRSSLEHAALAAQLLESSEASIRDRLPATFDFGQ